VVRPSGEVRWEAVGDLTVLVRAAVSDRDFAAEHPSVALLLAGLVTFVILGTTTAIVVLTDPPSLLVPTLLGAAGGCVAGMAVIAWKGLRGKAADGG
jgi:hypothetical protein